MKHLFYIFTFILISISAIGAQVTPNSGMRMNAEYIDYDNVSGIITASNNVTVHINKAIIKTDYVIYNRFNETLFFPNTVRFEENGSAISADNLQYNTKKYKGSADKLYGNIGRLNLRGERITFSPLKIEIYDATFTTCDIDNPQYKLDSNYLVLYPQFGFFVGFNNWFNAKVLPFPIWVPSYLYGSKQYSLLAKPLPDFGSNPREGFYIKQRFGMFINKSLNASIDIGHTEKLGYWKGGTLSKIVDDTSLITAELHHTDVDEFEGGILYRKSLTIEDKQKYTGSLLGFLDENNNKNFGTFQAKYYINEIYIDSRVDSLPELSFQKNRFSIANSKINGSFFVSGGYYDEITALKVKHAEMSYYFTGRVERDIPLTKRLSSNLSLSQFSYFYETSQPWQRSVAEYNISYAWSFLNPSFSYRELITEDGRSPFIFQNIYAIAQDEFGIYLRNRTGDIELYFNQDFSANTGEARRREFGAIYHMGCWNLYIAWETVQEQFNFGFNFY